MWAVIIGAAIGWFSEPDEEFKLLGSIIWAGVALAVYLVARIAAL